MLRTSQSRIKHRMTILQDKKTQQSSKTQGSRVEGEVKTRRPNRKCKNAKKDNMIKYKEKE